MRAATAVQVLQDLFLCFIACFILLVIAPLVIKLLITAGIDEFLPQK